MRAALHIGEVAQLLGVTQKTIRHYHKVGLLAEPERSQGGYRLYTASDLVRLLRIRRLQALGLSLKQIKGILGVPDQERPLREVLQALLADLAAQIEALERRRERVRRLLAEDTLEAIDEPSQMPALLQWAQAHLGEHLPQASADVWEQDARIFGLLEAFRWPESAQAQMQEAIALLFQQPEQVQRMAALAEQLAALAAVPEDSPEVERLVEYVLQSGAAGVFQSAASLHAYAPEGPFGEVMGDLMLSALSPAQRRFLALIQHHLKQASEEQP
jgi:DNA-binding transcriptional MerR regulator